MVQAQAAPSPSYRTVRTYEHNAQLNAMRRARDVANWSAGSNVEEVRQLDGLIAALEERKYESDGSRKRFIEKTEERQQKLQQKDSELLQLLVADEKKRSEHIKEVKRGKMEAIVEHNEKCQSATAECDLRLREIAKDRAKKLHEVSQRRFKRLEAIEAKKKRVVREQQQQRERDDQARDEKQASLAQLREAREARLEEELAEKTRLMRLRRQASEAARAEKAELHERHRKEVAKQADTSASTRQDELSAQIEVREWRVKRFRHEQVEVLKERTRLYDERKRSKDDKLSQNSDLKLRSMQKQEKRRLEKEKRVEQNLEKKKADHEAKVRSQARKRLRVTEAARTLIEERCDEKAHKVLRKQVEVADRILTRLDETSQSPQSQWLPLIHTMDASVAGSPHKSPQRSAA